MTQSTWLAAQLADVTAYTFVVRHEPPYDTQAPGVSPSETLIHKNPLTLEFLGHTHEYRRVDTQRRRVTWEISPEVGRRLLPVRHQVEAMRPGFRGNRDGSMRSTRRAVQTGHWQKGCEARYSVGQRL